MKSQTSRRSRKNGNKTSDKPNRKAKNKSRFRYFAQHSVEPIFRKPKPNHKILSIMIEEFEDEVFTLQAELETIKNFDLTEIRQEDLFKLKGQTAVLIQQIRFYRAYLQNIQS